MEKYRRGVDQIVQHVQIQIKRANTFSACPNLKKKNSTKSIDMYIFYAFWGLHMKTY